MDKDLVPKADQSLATPDTPKRGFEEPTQKEDLIIPRAKLMQAMSPEITEGEANLKVGQIINSLSLEVLPTEFIPIFKFTTWIRFNPRDDKDANFMSEYGAGDIIWRSNDPFDPKVLKEGKWGDDGTAPIATKFLNFFSIFPEVEHPLIVSFSVSSFKAGKKLLSLAKFANCDMFSRKYALTSSKVTNDKGTFYVLGVDPVGKVEGDEYAFCEKIWEEFHAKELKIHEPAAEETDGGEYRF